jgi:hypothetical protein
VARIGLKQPRAAPLYGHASGTNWSDDRVVGTTQESNVWQPGGTWTLSVEPRTGGGSHIRMVLDRHWKGRGWFFAVPVAVFGRQMLGRNLQKTLDVLTSSSS